MVSKAKSGRAKVSGTLLRAVEPAIGASPKFLIGNFIILAYTSKFGEPAVAGYGSATRFEQILLLPVLGLNTAI